jgi:hypothetical protein
VRLNSPLVVVQDVYDALERPIGILPVKQAA